MKRLLAVGSTLLLSVALLAGCGSTDDHNAQDVTFAKDMTPHHEQAVVMADLALAQASSQQVKDLATRIKAAQGPEITKMKGWLSSWGEKAQDDMGGMDMSTMPGMEGMVNDAGMQALRGASGAPFDRLFLQDMTGHHQGAVGMAKIELEKGKFGDAKALAREITTSQEKEISEMGQLLQSLPA
ncbi:MAG: DUF305 domain-containing protein [Acidimicrobiales bacterium]